MGTPTIESNIYGIPGNDESSIGRIPDSDEREIGRIPGSDESSTEHLCYKDPRIGIPPTETEHR